MRTINDWFEEYGESHQNPTNKLIHWICVPLIFFSIMGLLYSVKLHFISDKLAHPVSDLANLGSLISILVLLFYLRLSFKLFIGIFVIILVGLAACFVIQNYVPIALWKLSLIVFVLAWAGQFYGHKLEGKKPSFLKDIQFLLIGPAWVLAFLYRKLNIKI